MIRSWLKHPQTAQLSGSACFRTIADERDRYLASAIQDACCTTDAASMPPDDNATRQDIPKACVAIVGCAHVPGVRRYLAQMEGGGEELRRELSAVEERTAKSLAVGWGVPLRGIAVTLKYVAQPLWNALWQPMPQRDAARAWKRGQEGGVAVRSWVGRSVFVRGVVPVVACGVLFEALRFHTTRSAQSRDRSNPHALSHSLFSPFSSCFSL
jgi:hypothetical protein